MQIPQELAPLPGIAGRLPGFIGPNPSTSLDKANFVFNFPLTTIAYTTVSSRTGNGRPYNKILVMAGRCFALHRIILVMADRCPAPTSAHNPLPITHYPTPITYYPLPITYYLRKCLRHLRISLQTPLPRSFPFPAKPKLPYEVCLYSR
jgi:hypothetical protein